MTNKEVTDIEKQIICKGCISYEFRNGCVALPIIHKGTDKELICPCSTCLIKGICVNVEGCELIDKYYKEMEPIREQMNPILENEDRARNYI